MGAAVGYMGSVDSFVDALTARIGEVDCCARYKAAKAAVESDAELSAVLAAFRAAHGAAVSDTANGAALDYDRERSLSGLYWRLTLNDDAKELLRYEKETVTLVYDILRKIVDAAGISDDLLL